MAVLYYFKSSAATLLRWKNHNKTRLWYTERPFIEREVFYANRRYALGTGGSLPRP
jgi:hypothetical protein